MSVAEMIIYNDKNEIHLKMKYYSKKALEVFQEFKPFLVSQCIFGFPIDKQEEICKALIAENIYVDIVPQFSKDQRQPKYQIDDTNVIVWLPYGFEYNQLIKRHAGKFDGNTCYWIIHIDDLSSFLKDAEENDIFPECVDLPPPKQQTTKGTFKIMKNQLEVWFPFTNHVLMTYFKKVKGRRFVGETATWIFPADAKEKMFSFFVENDIVCKKQEGEFPKPKIHAIVRNKC
jgi:hypothetical protein